MAKLMCCMALGLAGVLAGCGSGGNGALSGVGGLSANQAESLNAQHARFEQAEDPPISAQTRFAAGQLAESQENLPQAIAQYESALKADPHHLPSLYRLGIVYAQAKAYPQAIAAWKNYAEQTREDATALGNLGFCYELAGQSQEAEAAYKRGIAREPKNSLCRVNYGLMLARAGRSNEAIVQLQAVLSDAQVHYNLGSVYQQPGKMEQAKAEYRKALDAEPGMEEAKMKLAEVEK